MVVLVYHLCRERDRERERLEFNGVLVQPTEHTHKQNPFEILLYTVTPLAGLQMYSFVASSVSPLQQWSFQENGV